jgi:hypothetical protein
MYRQKSETSNVKRKGATAVALYLFIFHVFKFRCSGASCLKVFPSMPVDNLPSGAAITRECQNRRHPYDR